MYGSESWGMKVTEKQKLNVLFRTKDLPSFINNRLSSRSSECTAARFKYPANRLGGGGRYSLPLRAVSSPRHSPLSSQPEWTCVA